MIHRNLNKRISSLHLKLLDAKFTPIDQSPLDVSASTNEGLASSQVCYGKDRSFRRGELRERKTMFMRVGGEGDGQGSLGKEAAASMVKYLDVDTIEIFKKIKEKAQKESQQKSKATKNKDDPQVERQKRLIKILQRQNKLLQNEITKGYIKMKNQNGMQAKNIRDIRVFQKESHSLLENSQLLQQIQNSVVETGEKNGRCQASSQYAVDNKRNQAKVLRKWVKFQKHNQQNKIDAHRPVLFQKTKVSKTCHVSRQKSSFEYQRPNLLNEFQGLYQKIQKHKEQIKNGQIPLKQKKGDNKDYTRKIAKSLSKNLQHIFGSKQMRVSELVKNLR